MSEELSKNVRDEHEARREEYLKLIANTPRDFIYKAIGRYIYQRHPQTHDPQDLVWNDIVMTMHNEELAKDMAYTLNLAHFRRNEHGIPYSPWPEEYR